MSNGHTQTLTSVDILLALQRISDATDAVRLAAIDAYRLGQAAELDAILEVFNQASRQLCSLRGAPNCPWPTRPVGDMCV